MPTVKAIMGADSVPCCPELDTEDRCDVLTFDYRLTHPVRDVNVEVILRTRLERCSGDLVLGDLVHSITLLPGEKVRLFTTNRRGRFTYDSETGVTYHHEQTSEESYYMNAMSAFMSDLESRRSGGASSESSSSFNSDGGTSGFFETIFAGPSVDVSGSYNAASTSDFLMELESHARSSHERSVEATRAAGAVTIGEVQSRSHTEGESESSFEAVTRLFSNPNRCRAVTFFSYQINKRQTVRFIIERIDRRVVDPAGNTAVTNNPPKLSGEVSVIPQGVLATAPERVEIESVGRGSVSAARAGLVSAGTAQAAGAIIQPITERLLRGQTVSAFTSFQAAQPLPKEVREAALKEVDAALVDQGLIDKIGGGISKEAKSRFSFEFTTTLPTPGILVKGCLDNCGVCEPELQREMELELTKKELENRLLERQIELLEKTQEYRCCRASVEEDEGDA